MFEVIFATSMSVKLCSFLCDLDPRTHNNIDLNNENDIFVRMKVVDTATDVFLFSAIISDERL